MNNNILKIDKYYRSNNIEQDYYVGVDEKSRVMLSHISIEANDVLHDLSLEEIKLGAEIHNWEVEVVE